MEDASPVYKRRAKFRLWRNVTIKILLLLTVIGFTIYTGHLLWEQLVENNKELQLKEIELHTNGQMTVEEIKKILHITGEENILFLDEDNYTQRLRSRPDILKVSVQKRLPSTLVVELEERHPIAWLECPACDIYPHDEASGFLLDSHGYIFRYDHSLHHKFKTVPVLNVRPPKSGTYQEGQWIQDLHTRQGLTFLKEVFNTIPEGIPPVEHIDNPNDWSMLCKFSNGMEITFGLFEHDRQLHDLALIMKYASDTNRKIYSANMIPEKNIPVFFSPNQGQGIANHPSRIVESEIVIDDVFEPEPEPPPIPPVAVSPAPASERNASPPVNSRSTATTSPAPRRAQPARTQQATPPTTTTRQATTTSNRQTTTSPSRETTKTVASNNSSSSTKTTVKTNTRKIVREQTKTQTPSPSRQQRQQVQPAPQPARKPPVEVPSFNF